MGLCLNDKFGQISGSISTDLTCSTLVEADKQAWISSEITGSNITKIQFTFLSKLYFIRLNYILFCNKKIVNYTGQK